jgi:diguanylate cyclase (GGDEF)-like protein
MIFANKTSGRQGGCMALKAPNSHTKLGTILIADNDPASRAELTAVLQQQGYQTLAASCDEQVLDIALHAQPDLILLEAAVPGIDGLDTCRRLKADSITAHIPVIFVSARAETEDIVAGFDIGAADYVTKPPRMPELCARVRAQLHHKRSAHALAMIDPLTRIANRRRFDSFFQREWQRGQRNGAPVSLLMIDVDHFKLFNDALGHAAGDACLQQVAGVIQQRASRAADLAARYGGEEFVVLFGETPPVAAAALAEGIRAAVEALCIVNPRSPTCGYITVSIGLAGAIPSQDDSVCSLLLAADRRLYLAKEAGRNRVETGLPRPGE